MANYRAKLGEVARGLVPRPSEDQRWTSQHSHEWFTLDWNAQRLVVLDHDIDALIAELRDTHRRRPRLQQEFNRVGLP